MHNAIQIVDDNDRPIGSATKQETWAKGLRHRITQVLVVSSEGAVLLQRRSEQKELWPNVWDFSAAGHVDYGEDYEMAAHREMQEEIGIDFNELREVTRYRKDRVRGDKTLNRFYRVFEVRCGPQRNVVVQLDNNEVSEVRWFTLAEVKTLLRDHPEELIPSLRQVLTERYVS